MLKYICPPPHHLCFKLVHPVSRVLFLYLFWNRSSEDKWYWFFSGQDAMLFLLPSHIKGNKCSDPNQGKLPTGLILSSSATKSPQGWEIAPCTDLAKSVSLSNTFIWKI